jgi:hypothetical protein
VGKIKEKLNGIEPLIYAAATVVFLSLGFLVSWSADLYAFEFFTKPFEYAGKFIRAVSLSGGIGATAAYALYTALCLAPLYYPVIRAVKAKGIKKSEILRGVLWLAVSAALFYLMYFAINPHLIKTVADGISAESAPSSSVVIDMFRAISFIGIALTFYAGLALAVLAEAAAAMKKNDGRAYSFARLVTALIIITLLYSAFFINSVELKTALAKFKADSAAGSYTGTVDYTLVYFGYFLRMCPALCAVYLLLCVRFCVAGLKNDMLCTANAGRFNELLSVSKISAAVILLAAIAENVLNIALAGSLKHSYFRFEIPAAMIFATCLIAIVCKLLLRAIELNEESKLVI